MSYTLPASLTSINLVVDWSSSLIRLIFHVYLGVVAIIIGLIGDRCCAARARFKLIRGRPLRLTYLTGWFSNWDVFLTIKDLHTLPCGWVGLLMILALLLSWADTLIVATLIRTAAIHTQCTFGTGMVISNAIPGPDSDLTTLVPFNGAPTIVAQQAQIISMGNGGLIGVYKKVNRDGTFSATQNDLLGGWECTQLGQELVFPSTSTIEDILNTAQNNNLTYPNGGQIIPCASTYADQNTGHLVWLDSSTSAEGLTNFDVRVTFDLGPGDQQSKEMKTFECSTNDPRLDGIMQQMYAAESLAHWCETFQGALYDGTGTPASSQAQTIIETYLNTMLMVVGGNNYLLSTSEANSTQGCLVNRTTIHWVVFAFAGISTILLLGMLIWWLVLLWLIKHTKSRNRKALRAMSRSELNINDPDSIEDNIERETPGSVCQWMSQATRESRGRRGDGTAMKEKQLKRLFYGPTQEIPHLGVVEIERFAAPKDAQTS